MTSNIEKYNETLTQEERIKRAQEAGIASGIARREQRTFKDTLQTLLSLSLKSGESVDIQQIQSMADLKKKNISVQEAILIAQIQKAIKGDTTAAVYVRDTSGQRPTEAVDMKMNLPVFFEGEDELEE